MALALTQAPKDIGGAFSSAGERLHVYGAMVQDWIVNNWVELAFAVTFGLIFYVILTWLRRKAASIARHNNDSFSFKIIAARTLGRTSRFFRFMVSSELVNSLTNAPPMVAKGLGLLFTVAVILQVAMWAREIILGFIERRASDTSAEYETLANAMALIRLLVSCAVFAIAAIFILDNLGVNVTGLIAGLGVGGIAIGLAAQGIFSDLFAAIAIIFDKPFRNGDAIRYNGSTGTVEKIGMKSTRLRSITGELLVISNAKLLDMEITNYTQTSYRRTNYPIGVIYQTSPEKALAIPALLEEIITREGAGFVRAGFTGFGDSALNFELLFDVVSNDFEQVFATRHRIGIAIVQEFAARGYEFAYPTQTTFTAAPDGAMIMPYADRLTPTPANRSVRAKK